MKSAREIVFEYGNGRLATVPSCYAGRGNNRGDLNSEILEMLYGGIKKEIGADAAKGFVNMVGEMQDDASTTRFLVSLYGLEKNGWKFSPAIMPKDECDAIAQSISDDSKSGKSFSLAEAFGVVGAFSKKSGYVASGINIVGDFLLKHKDELDKPLPSYIKKGIKIYTCDC